MEKYVSKGTERDIDSLKYVIEYLLRRGAHGGELLIEDHNSNKLFIYRKYINKKKDYGLYFFIFVNNDKKIKNEIMKLSNERNLNAEEIDNKIKINFSKDSSLAYDFMCNILTAIFNSKDDSRFYTKLNNKTHPFDGEIIGE